MRYAQSGFNSNSYCRYEHVLVIMLHIYIRFVYLFVCLFICLFVYLFTVWTSIAGRKTKGQQSPTRPSYLVHFNLELKPNK